LRFCQKKTPLGRFGVALSMISLLCLWDYETIFLGREIDALMAAGLLAGSWLRSINLNRKGVRT